MNYFLGNKKNQKHYDLDINCILVLRQKDQYIVCNNNLSITVLAVYAKIKGYSNIIQFDANTAI